MKWACVIHKSISGGHHSEQVGQQPIGFLLGHPCSAEQGKLFLGQWSQTGAPGAFLAKNGCTCEYNSDREGCLPNLIGQHPFSPVFGQKRPVAPDY